MHGFPVPLSLNNLVKVLSLARKQHEKNGNTQFERFLAPIPSILCKKISQLGDKRKFWLQTHPLHALGPFTPTKIDEKSIKQK